jgi:transposase-like protein
MAFSEKIINQVKELADFRCCRCHHISFEVHHIIPQKDGGPDTLENAAPLCPNCHADFGDNKIKRKEITQMRDLWYRRVKEMYDNQTPGSSKLLNDISTKLEALTVNHDKALIDLKETLKKVAIETIEHMTARTAQMTASGIANATVQTFPIGKGRITEVYDTSYMGMYTNRIKCPKCGTLKFENMGSISTGLIMPKHYRCETCGTEFEP